MILISMAISINANKSLYPMSESYIFTKNYINSLLRGASEETFISRLAKKTFPLPPRVPGGSSITPEAIAKRLQLTGLSKTEEETLLDPRTFQEKDAYEKNIENFIGTVKVPVGLVGPLR